MRLSLAIVLKPYLFERKQKIQPLAFSQTLIGDHRAFDLNL
jgi:hypothetical protein